MSHSSPSPSRRRSGKKTADSLRGFKFLDLGCIPEMRRTDIAEYIGKLHKLLKRTGKKVKKYKERCSKLKKKRTKDSDSDSSSSDDEHSATTGTTVSQPAAAATTPTDEVGSVKCDEAHFPGDAATTTVEDPLSFVDDMKRAAQQMAGFVYEPTSGLYYDCKTGYYYNAEHNLYYDGNTGCYYDYDKTTNKFVFHSQAYAETTAEPVAQNQSTKTGTDKSADTTSKKVDYRRHQQTSNVHQPCASQPDATSRPTIDHLLRQMSRLDIGRCRGNALDIARKYPPSLRLVVLETVQPKLRVGQLFMITYKGGSLGREGAHDVIIPDINVSKFHLTFKYNHDDSRYECVDLGSRNGTVLNGRRMSNAKQESEPQPVLHGAIIGLSQTRLLCHVHEGHSTCDECEPGMRASVAAPPTAGSTSSTTAEGCATEGAYLTHKKELKQLKKRYGLADQKYLIQQSTMGNDRSAQRRAQVGSTDGNEKTQVASVDTNISANNKGFKMLAKLGWSQGQKLGKNDSGLLEPIPLVSNTGSKGLGCEEFVPAASAPSAQKRAEQMRKTQQERFNRNATHDIFGDDGELDV